MPILTMHNVTKRFSGNVEALRGVSLAVDTGEAVAIIGSSGSGKSTLLRCVNNLERVSGGAIVVDGEVLVNTDEAGKVRYPADAVIRRITTKTSMVFQHFNLFPHLSCLANVTIAPVHILGQNKEQATEKALALLRLVGLSDKADCYPEQLSGGQQQRVAIARALAMDPQIMLFDEPTSALDPEITNEVTSVIMDLVRRHITMLIVTHDMRFARDAASRLIFMDEGQIVEQGDPRQLFDEPASERLREFIRSYQTAT